MKRNGNRIKNDESSHAKVAEHRITYMNRVDDDTQNELNDEEKKKKKKSKPTQFYKKKVTLSKKTKS